MHSANRVVEVRAQENCEYASIVKVQGAFDELPRRLGRYSHKPVQHSADRCWMPSAAKRGPNTTLSQFCCDLPQRRAVGDQICEDRL